MGFLDKIAKAVKIAEDYLDDGKINNSNGSLSKSVSVQTNQTNSTVSNSTKTPAKSGGNKEKTTPPEVLASGCEPVGNMKKAEDFFFEGEDSNTKVRINFEIPETFTEFDSGAEPESCHMYMADDDFSLNCPVFCITPENYAYNAIKEFKNKGTVSGVRDFQIVGNPNDPRQKALFKAKSDYFGQTVYFYGVQRGNDNSPVGFSMVYCNDVVGTPLENKLMKILDHIIETYVETIE